MIRTLLFSLALAAPAFPGACEDQFSKSGNPLTGTKYQSTVTVPDLTVEHAIHQLHGIAVAKKLDILIEDAPNGSMALEDRASMRHKAIPYVIAVTSANNAATINVLVKLNKGAIAKADDARTEICSILNQVQGGEAGRAAAKAGAGATSNEGPRRVDAFVLSSELAREAQDSAESIPLRYKGRSFTISGRVDYVIKDGNVYRIGYDIPDPRNSPLQLPNSPSFRISINCLMAPSHSVWALALRKGEKVKLTGTYADFDYFKKAIWFDGCRPE